MNKSIQQIFLFFLVVSIITSCRTTKQNSIVKKTTEIPPVITINQTDSIISSMSDNQFNFDWFTAKFSATFEVDNEKSSFNGQVRMKRDSIIWLSLSKFSIEGARIMITQDSIFYINRMEDSYFKSDFGYINRFVNNAIDFDMLQAFIVGNDFKYYENDKFKSSFDGSNFYLNTVNRHKLKKYIKNENESLKILVQSIAINSKTFKIKELTVKEVKANNKLEIKYDNFVKLNNQLFPSLMDITIHSEKNINISVSYSKLTVNEVCNFPFKIPENYTNITPK